MSGLADALVILAAVALVVSRQIRPQRVGGSRRWWLVPGVLLVLALCEPGLVDPAHRGPAVALLAVEMVTGLLVGAAWAWTSRVWAEPDGSVWARGTRATAVAWGVGIALRLGLMGLGAEAGIHQGTGAVLLALGLSLLTRSGVLMWRARSLAPARADGTAYREGIAEPAWEDGS